VVPKERDATEILRQLAQRDKAVNESLTVRTFGAGQTVCKAEEMASFLWLLVSGRVQLFRMTDNGRRFVVATLEPGSVFGGESLLGDPRPTTWAVALEPCTVWIFSAQRVVELSTANAMFGFGLMQAMGQRVTEAERRLERMAYSTISARLAALLLELGGDEPDMTVRTTHRELADMLGTWRETISKTLQDFRCRGLVASRHRRLTLLDREGLALEAGRQSLQ
jgi:CRP-like cAMP-binding protein